MLACLPPSVLTHKILTGFRENRDLEDPEEIQLQIDVALNGLGQIRQFTRLDKSSPNWNFHTRGFESVRSLCFPLLSLCSRLTHNIVYISRSLHFRMRRNNESSTSSWKSLSRKSGRRRREERKKVDDDDDGRRGWRSHFANFHRATISSNALAT